MLHVELKGDESLNNQAKSSSATMWQSLDSDTPESTDWE